MKAAQVTLRMGAADAEPILRTYAYQAAKYGALADFITINTVRRPGHSSWHPSRAVRMQRLADDRKEWQALFLRGKRVVESFGVEYQPTSEQETLTVYFPQVEGATRKGALGFNITEGSRPDYDNPMPQYYGEVHSQACQAAADRVVRTWRAKLEQEG